MNWLALSIEVPHNQADPAEHALETSGAFSVTLSDAGDDPVLETAPGETRLWPTVRLTGLYAPDTDPEDVRLKLAAALGEVGVTMESSMLADREWTRAWMDRFGPMRFGQRLWIVPRQADEPDTDGVFIRLDPGLAFGTGTHATTALCLEWLDANPPGGARVIDYGCGSGVLGIAAARLGAESVWCVDHDRQALNATRDNAADNGASACLRVCAPSDMPAVQADLLMANILFQPLKELAGEFAWRTKPGGHLVMSGLLEAQAQHLVATYDRHFEDFKVTTRDGWSRVVAHRRPL